MGTDLEPREDSQSAGSLSWPFLSVFVLLLTLPLDVFGIFRVYQCLFALVRNNFVVGALRVGLGSHGLGQFRCGLGATQEK